MNIKVFLHKRNEERTVIVHVVKQSAQDVSLKVMAKSSTMLVRIVQVDSRMWRQELPVVMQIVFANLQGLRWP